MGVDGGWVQKVLDQAICGLRWLGSICVYPRPCRIRIRCSRTTMVIWAGMRDCKMTDALRPSTMLLESIRQAPADPSVPLPNSGHKRSVKIRTSRLEQKTSERHSGSADKHCGRQAPRMPWHASLSLSAKLHWVYNSALGGRCDFERDDEAVSKTGDDEREGGMVYKNAWASCDDEVLGEELHTDDDEDTGSIRSTIRITEYHKQWQQQSSTHQLSCPATKCPPANPTPSSARKTSRT